MPSMRAFIPQEEETLKEKVNRAFADIKTERLDVNLVIIDVELGVDSEPYLEIRSSHDLRGGAATLIKLANRFLRIIDVELYHPQTGIMAFGKRGSKFTNDCFGSSSHGL